MLVDVVVLAEPASDLDLFGGIAVVDDIDVHLVVFLINLRVSLQCGEKFMFLEVLDHDDLCGNDIVD